MSSAQTLAANDLQAQIKALEQQLQALQSPAPAESPATDGQVSEEKQQEPVIEASTPLAVPVARKSLVQEIVPEQLLTFKLNNKNIVIKDLMPESMKDICGKLDTHLGLIIYSNFVDVKNSLVVEDAFEGPSTSVKETSPKTDFGLFMKELVYNTGKFTPYSGFDDEKGIVTTNRGYPMDVEQLRLGLICEDIPLFSFMSHGEKDCTFDSAGILSIGEHKWVWKVNTEYPMTDSSILRRAIDFVKSGKTGEMLELQVLHFEDCVTGNRRYLTLGNNTTMFMFTSKEYICGNIKNPLPLLVKMEQVIYDLSI